MNNSILLTLASGNPCKYADLLELGQFDHGALSSHLDSLVAAELEIKRVDDTVQWLNPFDCLQPEAIAPVVGSSIRVVVLDTVTSTNTVLADLKQANQVALLAEHQSAGRGRRGSSWLSPAGRNLYLSVGWSLPREVFHPAIALAVGTAVVGVMRDYTEDAVGLKWPNDIYVNNKKLGGILVESIQQTDRVELTIGLGLNVLLQSFPDDLGVAPICLQEVAVEQVDRNKLAAEVINAIAKVMSEIESVGMQMLLKQWQTFDLSYNQLVDIKVDNKTLCGTARGIDGIGNLQVEIDGELQTFTSADVSLRLNHDSD